MASIEAYSASTDISTSFSEPKFIVFYGSFSQLLHGVKVGSGMGLPIAHAPWNVYLKGQCHKIFGFWFFSWISFPQASDYTIRAVSNFFRKFAEILTLVANLPPVSLTPVVHLDLRISPRIFEKIRNDPYVISRGLGEGDSWKNLKQKISWHCPFKGIKSAFIPIFSLLCTLKTRVWKLADRYKCTQLIGEIFPTLPLSFCSWGWIADKGVDYEIRWVRVNSGI